MVGPEKKQYSWMLQTFRIMQPCHWIALNMSRF
nr:MAG TPA: hypothetical protein [Caudoviricetes sp.]